MIYRMFFTRVISLALLAILGFSTVEVHAQESLEQISRLTVPTASRQNLVQSKATRTTISSQQDQADHSISGQTLSCDETHMGCHFGHCKHVSLEKNHFEIESISDNRFPSIDTYLPEVRINSIIKPPCSFTRSVLLAYI